VSSSTGAALIRLLPIAAVAASTKSFTPTATRTELIMSLAFTPTPSRKTDQVGSELDDGW